MKTLFLSILGTLLLINFSAKSQQIDSTTQNIPAQLTLIYPVGTNGTQSGKISNNLSINLFAGYNESLNGIELGGFANTIRKDMKGVQMAGFSNVVLGETEGLQLSGFSNYSNDKFKGCQIAGFSNVINDSAIVSQISGFSNLINGDALGVQFSGFSNITSGSFKGIQASGYTNIVKGKMIGSQLSGFSNVAFDTSTIIQISGFSNIVKGKTSGAQISGFSNICTNDLEGIQLSGFINIAKNVNGSQIGFINFCDSMENGIPIGFLSVVKHGFRSIDISYDETQFFNLSFNTGTDQFYNIFTAGTNFRGNKLLWGVGYGVGTKFHLSNRFDLNIEAISSNINYDYWVYEDYQVLNKLRLNASWKIINHLQLFGGISYNVFVTNERDFEGNFVDNGLIPWATQTYKGQYNMVKMYPGFNIGIRFTN